MSSNRFQPPNILIKEIQDLYAQENWYKLKIYLDRLCRELDKGLGESTSSNPGGGNSGGGNNPVVSTGVVSRTMDCAASVQVGDWVYQSLSTDNFAVSVSDNNPPAPVIGKVSEKPSSTQATVVFSGIVADTVSRGRIFLGLSGQSTASPPTTGFVQRLGISFGDGQMVVNPELHRVKKL